MAKTVKEQLQTLADRMNEHPGYRVSFLQKHPDDDPMIGLYDPDSGDYVLAHATAYADRATGGGAMAANWLLEFLNLVARAQGVRLKELEAFLSDVATAEYVDEDSPGDKLAVFQGLRDRACAMVAEAPGPGEGWRGDGLRPSTDGPPMHEGLRGEK